MSTTTNAAPHRQGAPEAAPATPRPVALAQTITAAAGPDWQTEIDLLAWLPISRRTVKEWRDRGKIPFVRLPGSRRIIYHRPSVEAALLRCQRGGHL